MGHAPRELLAKNFGLPASAFDEFPKGEVYLARGPRASAEPPLTVRGAHDDPPLSHRYPLLSQRPHATFRGGREWRVDASQFPISRTVTGVVLDLEPGAMRELHWHPTADEWQYLIRGQTSVTLFGAGGRFRTERMSSGDVAYIPQGYGHSIENVGPETCRVLITLNTGHYEAIDLSQWIAANPAEVLATNFSQPASLFEKFPRSDVFVAPHD
jgi:oxalate decarboxylase